MHCHLRSHRRRGTRCGLRVTSQGDFESVPNWSAFVWPFNQTPGSQEIFRVPHNMSRFGMKQSAAALAALPTQRSPADDRILRIGLPEYLPDMLLSVFALATHEGLSEQV